MHVEQVTTSRTTELEGARADFLASLARRLGALRDRLELLAEAPDSEARRDGFLRRLGAMAAAARVLGFSAAADALEATDRTLKSSIEADALGPAELERARKALAGVPSLAWGAPASLPTRLPRLPETAAPGVILVFGEPWLSDALKSELPNVELEVVSAPGEALERTRALVPDAIVLDADGPRAREAMDLLSSEGCFAASGLVVVGSFKDTRSASDYIALGAVRALPKPASPEALRRALLEAFRSAVRSRTITPQEPVGDVTVAGLVERVSLEVRRGLLEAVLPGGESASVPLADGAEVLAAVWGAVARVREVVTLRSGGTIRFEANGPEGAVPLAGWSAPERAQGVRGDARAADDVTLTGRRAVVVDDDPAVVWFLAGLLGSVGFEVLEAHDGRRALDLCWLSWPDLVISDVLMPGLDGFSLCREIKRDVAVRDTPVILLSWKEDLLQRLRELGAEADGYLRKEASTALFVERAREVLRPRARVENRLRSGGAARGRLDGLTPRLVLELAGRELRDARVSVRDAVHLYEIELRDGAPRCATRTSVDGSFERGERVLGALLGVGAGRFAIEPARGGCREDFDGSLQEVLAPAIRAARAASRALGADRLWDVQRVGLEMGSLSAYLRATPASIAGLVLRIANGTTPRALLADGSASPAVLEAVLADVARRGAVRSVDARDGTDLLEQARLGLGRRAEVPASGEGAPASEPAKDDRFSFELSPALSDAAMRECSMPPAPSAPLSPQPAGAAPSPASRANGPSGAGAPAAAVEPDARDDESVSRAPAAGGTDPAAAQPPETIAGPEPATPEDAPAGPSIRRLAFPGVDRPAAALAAPCPPPATPSMTARDEVPSGASQPVDRAPRVVERIERPAAPAVRAVVAPLPGSGATSPARAEAIAVLPAARSIVFPVKGGSAAEAPRAPEFDEVTPAPQEGDAAAPRADGAPTPPSGRTRPNLGATLRVAAITVGAALVSFFGVSHLVGQAQGPAANAAASPSVAAAPALLAASAAPAPAAAPAAKIEELPLPVGIEPSPGQGLLEIVTREREAIYVQDTFMGTGPVRPVLLTAGPHQVRVSLEGQSRSFDVTVVPGRRTRLDVSGS